MTTDSGIGAFLRSRRARIAPAAAGSARTGSRRRVQGLRREELAELAGMSVDYYIRLEQGRAVHVSDSGARGRLPGAAAVLAEREHLANLARPPRQVMPSSGPESGGPEAHRLVNLITATPALVLNRSLDVLAWNATADAVFGFSTLDSQGWSLPNMAIDVFLNPPRRQFYTRWDVISTAIVFCLRLESGRHPSDPRLAALIDELARRSDDFRTLWGLHDVGHLTQCRQRIAHPQAGELEFDYQVLAVLSSSDQVLLGYTVIPETGTHERLQHLLETTHGMARPREP